MKFFDGDDAGSSNEGGWPLTRRVALAGTAAGAFALAGAGLMGCSATGAGASDVSSSDDELTDEQKKLHKQVVATYEVEKQATIKDQLDADYAADSFDKTAPFVKADPFGADPPELLRALCNIPRRHHFTSNSTRSSSGTLRSMSLRATWRSCSPSVSLVVT